MTGLTGLFSLGQGAFISIGAYTAAHRHGEFRGESLAGPWSSAVAMGVVSGFLVGLPTLKLRRDYFSPQSPSASGEMVRALLLWMAQLTGGAMGIAAIPNAAGLPPHRRFDAG